MFKRIKFFAALIFTGLLVACDSTNSKPLSIEFSTDSSKIIIKNINEAGLFQLKSNIKTDSTYQKIVSVLQTPDDDDSTSMEVEYPGELTVIGDSLVFTPKIPFVKGKVYLVESIMNAKFASSKDIVKADVGHTLKAQQKFLKR